MTREPVGPSLGERVEAIVARTRELRDAHGWPGPRSVDDLRLDPRVALRNRLARDYPTPDEPELAAALIPLVAEDGRCHNERRPEGQSGRREAPFLGRGQEVAEA